MTQDKDLLLKYLCMALPYGVKIMFRHNGFRWDWEQTLDEISKCEDGEYAINGWGIHGIKPYLRPMSSMTEEERKEYKVLTDCSDYTYFNTSYNVIEWLLKNHFDFMGLIHKGLAIEINDKNNPY